MNDSPGTSGIALARKLPENFIGIAAASRLDGGFGQAQSVDAPFDGFDRLGHGLILDGSDGAGAQSEGVARGITGSGRHVPNVAVLRAKNIAELRDLCGIDVADEDMSIVNAAHFIVMNIF